MKSIFALLLAGAVCFGTAEAAQSPAPTPKAATASAPRVPVAQDGKAFVEDMKVANVLRKASADTLTREAVIREMGPLLYADNKLTPNESDLIFELLGNTGGKVIITAADGDTFTIPPLTASAMAFLRLSDPPDLDQLWMQGRDPMRQLIDVTLLNPFVEGQVQRFIAQQFYLSWAASDMLNDYKPLRASLSVALDQLSTSSPATQKQARKLFYQAMVDVDRGAKDKIPNRIYAGLMPQEAAGN